MRYLNTEYAMKFKAIDHTILKNIVISAMDLDLVIYDYKRLLLIETKYSKNPREENPNKEWHKKRKQMMLLWNIREHSKERIEVYILYYSDFPDIVFNLIHIMDVDEENKKEPITFKSTIMTLEEYRRWRIWLNYRASNGKATNQDDKEYQDYLKRIPPFNETNIIKEYDRWIKDIKKPESNNLT